MSAMLRRTVLIVVVSASVPLIAAGHGNGRAQEVLTLSRKVFEDKVRGGWAGQMIGVSFGAPTEFKSNGKIIEGDLPAWTPDRIENAIDQDDLYVEMTFSAVMDSRKKETAGKAPCRQCGWERPKRSMCAALGSRPSL